MGYATSAVQNGEEALQLVERTRFDLGFIDAKLPDVDGIKLAARLRATRDELPLVLLSGYFYEDDSEVRASLSAGLFACFVSKPFLRPEIEKAVRFVSRAH